MFCKNTTHFSHSLVSDINSSVNKLRWHNTTWPPLRCLLTRQIDVHHPQLLINLQKLALVISYANQCWLHLPRPPATGQTIITNVNKHYPTSKYLNHCCQPTNLCLVVPISSLGLSWILCSSLIWSSAVLSTPSWLALTFSSCCTQASHNIVMRSSVTSCDNVTDHEHITWSLITDKYFNVTQVCLKFPRLSCRHFT